MVLPSVLTQLSASLNYNTTTKSAWGSLLGVQEGTESPPSRFERFSAIKPVSRIDAVQTSAKWHSVLETPNQMFRAQYFHGTMRPDAKRLYDTYLAWKQSVSKLSDVEGLYPTFVMNIMPKSAQSVARHNGIGNIWGLDDKESFVGTFPLLHPMLPRTTFTRSEFGKPLLAGLVPKMISEMGLASDFIYMGDASETQNPWLGIPFKNVEKLRQIRAKYDPEGVFAILNWGGYKLGH
ncbi:hypothetical protein BDP55DRAFT_628098 [Colletotrichum godetiae]|uniref:FAD binding domain-containing protein n=1 Tax=Colletotrichum godetiae TaxID=1209918 RepID=A0AAJ0AU57_9PEZI|nr:uncharacterized protein BDP55DRAFT_628098 [Colletotrichum godetiae]KAK1690426.1 hypothetical protein BDP55DRAFT_628098 [Colletotrichum godetiae]